MRLISALLAVSNLWFCASAMAQSDAHAEGEHLFKGHCESCHSGLVPEAPTVAALKLYPPERIIESLTSGVMSTAGLPLSGKDMQQVAFFLTGKQAHKQSHDDSFKRCSSSLSSRGTSKPSWTSWGGDGNQRFQSDETQITATNVARLELAWTFAMPRSTRIRSQPVVTADTSYVGSQDGTVYALETSTGCVRWTFVADAEVRGSVELHANAKGAERLYFGDFKANAYALDAANGNLLWKTRVHTHKLATITGSVRADQQRVYVPVSSSEVVPAGQNNYSCCSFRGALVALSVDDGGIEWTHYTTPEPISTGKNTAGTPRFGPSGAPVWSSPTLDVKRNLVLITTGQNYSLPATAGSDAVHALDQSTGRVRWITQLTQGDVWNGACVRGGANCPEEEGPDFDIGASAVLVTSPRGRDLVLAGQKSGMVVAMDPDQGGEVQWRQRVGRGGTMGGVHWGMSSDGIRLYVGISDIPTNNQFVVGEPQPGVHALDLDTGQFLWRSRLDNACASRGKFICFSGISAAISSSAGLVFAGGLDGILRAYSAENGKLLWSYNTARDFQEVNGIAARGGAIESDGPVIANGMLFVTSGYDKWAQMPGNVLLAFALPKRESK